MDRVPASAKAAPHLIALHDMERHIDELPLLPQVLARILLLKPDADDYFEQLAELANEDPGFAVRIVALANSAASSPAEPVCTIGEALSRMGARAVGDLVASLSVQRVFMPTAPAQVRLWQHAIETAVAARTIAKSLPGLNVNPDQAYVDGLLHDIGRFVMLEHAAPELKRVDDSHWETPEALVQADIDVYNYTHAELGYLACQHWGLPQSIADVVRLHHDDHAGPIVPGTTEANVFCIKLADRISVFLLERRGFDDLAPEAIDAILAADCLHTDFERNLVVIPVLRDLLVGIRDESQRLLSNLGFA